MVQCVAYARIDAYVLGLGAVLLNQLHDELLEWLMVSIEEAHVVIVAQEFGDSHDRVGQRVLAHVLLGIVDVIDRVVLVGECAGRFQQHNHAIVEQANPFIRNCEPQFDSLCARRMPNNTSWE